MTADRANYKASVIGCSAGGLEALKKILAPLPAGLPIPIIVVSHLSPEGPSLLVDLLAHSCRLQVMEAAEKSPALPGTVHVAPPGYHLLVESDGAFSLSVDDKVCNVRPSIDVLFESAADAWGAALIGVVLTGANSDGTKGLAAIKKKGGYGIVQDPEQAFADTMPRSAIIAGLADAVLPLEAIGPRLLALTMPQQGGAAA